MNPSPWLNELDRWFDFTFRDLVPGKNRDLRVRDTESSHVLELDLPGVAREDVNIERRQNQLVVYLYKDSENAQKLELPLSPKTDATGIEAEMNHGVLRITLPKAASEQTSTAIEIH